jgi:hypothetical protein
VVTYVLKAPECLPLDDWAMLGPTVFLAGSIEMGTAENWQERVCRALADKDVTILNPRRDDWDASWVQSADNPRFREQVEWELTALEYADTIATYFAPETKSPISLLELGLHAASGRMIVCCPDGFWRKGNVDMVCRRYDVEQVATLDDLVRCVVRRMEEDGAARELSTA